MDEGRSVRFWEVDAVRGLAVAMMVLYHLLFDLDYFRVHDFEVHSGFWLGFAHLTATIFVLLVGVSLMLSYLRAERLGQVEQFSRRLVKRGIWIFSLGLAITLVTYLLIGRGFIVFGVLHLIGVSMLLAYPFLRLKAMNVILGLLFILTGLYLQNCSFDFAWLLWLGLPPRDFFSLDYFPLLPWFGVVLLGMALSDHYYRGYSRRIPLPDLSVSFGEATSPFGKKLPSGLYNPSADIDCFPIFRWGHPSLALTSEFRKVKLSAGHTAASRWGMRSTHTTWEWFIY